MHLHVVGFGPKHSYGMASWEEEEDDDDDVNCYVSIKKCPEFMF